MSNHIRRLQTKLKIVSLFAFVVSAAAAQTGPAVEAFRDSADTPPPGWKGPRYKMSRDYPKQMPVCPSPWLKRPVSFSNPSANWNDWRG